MHRFKIIQNKLKSILIFYLVTHSFLTILNLNNFSLKQENL